MRRSGTRVSVIIVNRKLVKLFFATDSNVTCVLGNGFQNYKEKTDTIL